MSARNVHRNSYIEDELSDEGSSDSEGYLDDFRSLRGDRRESHRSLRSRRSIRSSPPRSIDFDEDSESFSRNESSRNNRRRSSSSAKNANARNERVTKKNTSDTGNTQDSESELGTRAKVQAKIREKIAQQQSSLDESSSDFFKPKTNSTTKNGEGKPATSKINGKAKKVSAEVQTNASVLKTEPKTAEHSSKPPLNEATTVSTEPTAQKAPSLEWQCEFCTFANELNTKICAICCRTPTNAPVNIQKANSTGEAANTIAPAVDDEVSKTTGSTMGESKGRERKLSKKISFWPGTKSK